LSAVEKARLVQLEASRPDRSVVLRAAAGSGKTTALVNRFLRLCLEDTPARVAPGTILAVTFTRKAAVEIQERLRREARKLALATPAARADQLRRIFGAEHGEPSEQEVKAAGALYEQLLADTSALNLGTIHSFCQVVLGRFAREAGLDPSFGVLEDPVELQDEAFDLLVGEIAKDPELAADARLLGAHPDTLRKTLQVCLKESMRIERWLQGRSADGVRGRFAAGADGLHAREPRREALPRLEADLRRHLFPDLPDADGNLVVKLGARLAGALQEFGEGLLEESDAMFGELSGKTRTNIEELAEGTCDLAAGWAPTGDDAADAAAARALAAGAFDLLLTKGGKVRSFTALRDPEFKAAFHAMINERARPALSLLLDIDRLKLLEKNVSLLRLGLRLLDLVDDLKRRDRVIDFQDLEDMASGLLADPERALDLQYRLDDAIQHILVDEFQDTNVNQWELLRPFVEEFRAGGGERKRTVFLVGDVKQSIYGFRGAWPRLFGEVADDMADYDCSILELPTNFRSRRAIVEGVGELFNRRPLDRQIEDDERAGVRQAWAREDEPGEFVVHAPFPGQDEGGQDEGGQDDDRRFDVDPVDADGEDDGPADPGGGEQAAARAAAALVRTLRDEKAQVFDAELNGPRDLQWRDVLVLARARTDFALYERAFRDAGIPFLPPGRGMLAASREAQDVLALLRWLAWPDDSVALATVLRSPIVRLDQAAFQALLSQRGVSEKNDKGHWSTPHTLWQAVRASADPRVAAACAMLVDWRRKLDFEPCHDLLRRLAGEADLPRRYQMALGEQARFNLERLYDLALGGDVIGTPTARRLAEVIAGAAGRGNQEEAPLPSDGEGRVRFLTVHGAKGLEAPVVLLVDADRKSGRASAQVCLDDNDHNTALLLKTTAGERKGYEFHEGVEPLGDPLSAAVRDAARRGEAERAHLLYVALTRARDRLHVIGGDQDRGGPKAHESPLRFLRDAVNAAPADGGVAELLVRAPGEDDDDLQRLALVEAAADATPDRHAPPPEPATWQPPVRRPRFTLVRPSAAADDTRVDRRDADDPDDQPAAEVARPQSVRTADEEEAAPAPRAPIANPLPPGVSPAEHGDEVHRLLQAACNAGAMPAGRGLAHDEASAVFAAPELSWVFTAPQDGAAFSEAPVIARRAAPGPGGVEQRITGIIDRLVVGPGRIDIVDYKTNRGAANATQRAWLIDHYRPQLAAYREVIAAAFPGREVRLWLLFTDPALAHAARLHQVG
jgi:ATP-dependent helicase/nuclease subunit A